MKLWSSTVVVAAGLLAGCASTGADQAAKTADILKKMAKEFDAAPAEVDAITEALSTLFEQGGDMRKEYDAFVKSVGKIESRAGRIRSLRDSLDGQRDAFTKSWNEQLQMIKSEDLRKRAEQRRDQVVATFEDLKAMGESVKASYDPWLAELKDIQAVLEFQLNPAGVADLADEGASVASKSDSLKASLDKLNAKMREVAKNIEATKPPPPEKTTEGSE